MKIALSTAIAIIAITASLACGVHTALAISRVNSISHTCAELRGIVARQGAVIIRHPGSRGSGVLYDKYVSNSNYCDASAVATEDHVPAKGGSCRLYNCQTYDPPFDDW